MFASIKKRINHVILAVTVALIASGVPVVQIVSAAECAGHGASGGCSG